MATLRNENTPEGKEMWRKVDEAANRAPQWIKDRVNPSDAQRPALLTQAERKNTETTPQQLK